MSLIDEIDDLLPQTQCGECGYPGCLPYAQALAQGQAPINLCPPGGLEVVQALGKKLNLDASPYEQAAIFNTREPAVAVIREDECVGCTKCISACPVDAIIGSAKVMHAILEHECTGCGLCVEPCPVDCIELVALTEPDFDKSIAKTRHAAKATRLLRLEHEKQQQYREKARLSQQSDSSKLEAQAKKDYILQALARFKAKGQ